MFKFHTRKRWGLLTLLTLLTSVQMSFGQILENFDTYPHNSSGYSVTIPDWTGVNGITWSLNAGAKNGSIVGTTPLLGTNGKSGKPKGGILSSSIISNGIGHLNFKYRKAFSSNSKLSVYINEILIEELDVSSKTPSDYNRDINISGDFTFKFVTTERTLIDEIEWVEYAGSNKDITVNLNLSETVASETDQTSITLSATASEPVSEDETIDLEITGTGITAGDYSLSTTQITIPAGQTTATATLSILDDSEVEGTENLAVSISNPSAGIILGSTISSTVEITDNDAASNDGSEVHPYTITEALALSKSSTKYFAFGYIVSVGDDFDAPFTNAYYITLADSKDEIDFANCLNLKLEAGVNRDTWNLKDHPDHIGKQIKFNGFRDEYSSHYSFEGNSIIVELSDEPTVPTVEFALSSTTASEANQTNITLTATTSASVSADQTVDLAISGTGITSGDYTLSTTKITIPAGQTTASASLNIVDDSEEEATENLTVSLNNPSAGIILGSTISGTVSIADNDASANDGSEVHPYTIAEALLLSESATIKHAYGYIVSVGSDFEAPFTNGNYITVADSKNETSYDNCLNLKLGSADKASWNLMDHPENIGKQIKFNGYRDQYFSHSSFEGNTIVIDLSGEPSVPTVEFAISSTTASEANQTSITLTATASTAVNADQTVDLAISGTGITAGDYSLSTTKMTILAGETSATASLSILDDSELEGTENLAVSLSNPSAGIILGTTFSGTISITDNDAIGGGGILDSYVYLAPETTGEGKIVVNMTPKEYVQTVSGSQHMNSVSIPENYYSEAVGLTNTGLRSKIQNIISIGAQAHSYSTVWDMCENGDENPKNASQVWQMYVETGIAKTAHVSGSSGWNREHTWAKSHGGFGTSNGRGTDGHHLRATDARENSIRGSRDFGNDAPGYTPPKSARGDVARMIFYMATRWDMTVDDLCKETESSPRHGKLSHLLEWHEEDPVDPYEVRRNNVIYGYQNNRNPFVDHPELVQYIFGEAKNKAWDGGQGTRISKIQIRASLNDFGMIKFGEESTVQTFSVSATELTENINLNSPQHFLISKDGSTYASSLVLSISNGQLAETNISVKFVPESAISTNVTGKLNITSGNESRMINVSGIEGDPALVPQSFLNEDFESDTYNNWILNSEKGSRNWSITEYSGTKYMQMSAYKATGEEVAWLITPALDLDLYSNEILTFKTKNGYYKGTTLEVLISTDFNGSDVSSANWQTLPATIDERNNSGFGSDFIESGQVDLSAYNGSAYVAFKYSGNGSALTTTYQLDDVIIQGLEVELTGELTDNLAGLGLEFPYTESGNNSSAKTYQLSFAKLEGDINLKTSSNYDVSLDGITWNSEISIAKTETSPQTIHVRYYPQVEALRGSVGTLSQKAKGAASSTINLSSLASSDIADASTLSHDKTFDVVSWNVEWFGSPAKSKHASSFSEQLEAVSAKIIELDADIYALQELVSDDLNGDFLQPLVNKLNELAGGSIYAGAMGPRYSHDDSAPSTEYPAQRVCYIYNTTSVANLNDYSMYSDLYQGASTTAIDGYSGLASKFWASGRLPYLFDAEVTIDGITENVKLINIHAKCCFDSHARKLADAKFLMNDLNTNYSDDKLIVLGDYNDYLEGSMSSGQESPYASWYTTNEYFDNALTSSTNIDHISISNELYYESGILTNNTLVENVSISDHHPIMLRLKLHAYSSQILAEGTNNLVFDYVDVDKSEGPSSIKSYQVKATDLSEDVSVSIDQPFQISLDGTEWLSSLSIAKADAANKEVKVRFNPTVAYTEIITGSIKHQTKGAKTLTIPVKAYGKPDFEAPQFISTTPLISNFDSSSCTMKVQLNEAGKIYYVVLNDNASIPTVDEVKLGTSAISSGSFNISTEEISEEVTGLSQNTDYDIYLVAEDNNEPTPNTVSEAVKLEVKTNDHTLLPFEYVSTVTRDQHFESTNIPVNYYQEARGNKAAELKTKLANIINQGFVSYPYEEDGRGDVAAATRRFVAGDTPLDVYDIMDEADRDPNNPNKIYLIYKELVYDTDSKHLGRNGSQEKWNREHVYPQSTGGFKNARAPWGSGEYANGNIIENAGNALALAQSDAHHLRSSDKNENSKRNNFPFANSTSGSQYAPPLSAKGDVARVIFYLNLRYGLDISQVGSVNMFLEWNAIDPVDPYEVRHNNVVYKYQKNRNPFIDYPELTQYLYGDKMNETWKAGVKVSQSINFPDLENRTFADAPFNLVANASSKLPVSFEIVSGPATITSNKLTLTGAGTITVKAIQEGNDNFTPAKGVSRTFKVSKAAQIINIAEFKDKIFGDAGFSLSASSTSGLTVNFELISGPATLVGDKLTPTGTGTVTVKAIQEGNENFTPAGAVIRTITVNKADQMITFAELSDKVYDNKVFELIASSSSDLAVSFELVSGPASIEGSILTITGTGTVTVKAVQEGNENFNPAEAVIRTLTVSRAEQIIHFAELADKTFGDASFILTASSTSELVVSFEVISGPASIEANTLNLTGAGTVTVKAMQEGNGSFAAAEEVSRTFNVSKADQNITFNELENKVCDDKDFDLIASSSSDLAVNFELVSGPASLSGHRIILTGTGIVTVKAIQAGNNDYNAAEEVIRTFTVNKADQSILFANLSDKSFGDPEIELSASATSGLTVSFELVSGPANLEGSTLSITGAGTVTVKAVQLGNSIFEVAQEVSRSFIVNKAEQIITFDPIDTYHMGDKPIQLIANSNSGLNVEFEIILGKAKIDGHTLTPASIGSVTIRALQLGDNNYNYAEAVQEFIVDQTTGIEDKFIKEVKLYPNPAIDYVNLDFPTSDLKQIKILNMKGQLVKTATAYDNIRLNIQDLKLGMYIIHIQSDKTIVTKRLLKVSN